jgi:hypothetical protein
MTQYRIAISYRGNVVSTHVVAANSALQAIAVVEKGLPTRPYTLSTHKGAMPLSGYWTGYEYEARQVCS